MSKKPSKPAAKVEPPKVEAPEPKGLYRRVKVVSFKKAQCPECNSTRSRFIYSTPGPDGRMERRRCKPCGTEFDAWDETAKTP